MSIWIGDTEVAGVGPRGATGPSGPSGPSGSTGPAGTSVVILGSVANAAALPGSASNGDGYIAADTGHLWVWATSAFVDVGAVRGPTGPSGATGPTGVGATGATGATGPSGATTLGSASGVVSGVINGTDVAYGMVADGQQITNAALTSGASPVLTSASNPFVSGDVGKVVQLYRDVVIPDASIASGTAVLTSASSAVPTWVQPGMAVHVGGAGTAGKTLETTVLTNDGTGQLTLSNNAVSAVTSKPTIAWGLFKSTVATYTNAGSVTLSGTAPFSFTGATAVWGTDNRSAYAAAAAAAFAANKPLYVPTGNYVVFVNSTNPNAMVAPTSGTFTLRSAGRGVTNFMVVTDGLTAAITTLVRRGQDASLDLADFKVSYYGPQTGNQNNVFQAIQFNGTGNVEMWLRMARVDFDATYRPILGVSGGAGQNYANKRIDLEDCQLYAVQSSALSFFVNPARSVATGVTTNASPTVTASTFALTSADLGKLVTGTGIPTNAYVGVVNSTTSLGLSSSPVANVPLNATATGSSLTITIGGADGRLWARRCRFDTSQQVQTDINDNAYHPHATYLHPSVSFDFDDCVFSHLNQLAGTYHIHGNGSATDATLFNTIRGSTFEGFGAGVLTQPTVTQLSLIGCTFKDSVAMGAWASSVDMIDCVSRDRASAGTYSGGAGTVMRIIGGSYQHTTNNTELVIVNSTTDGGTLIVEKLVQSIPTAWNGLVGLSSTHITTIVVQQCVLTGAGGNLTDLMQLKNAITVFFRDNVIAGSWQYGALMSQSATWTGRCVVDGNDFSAGTYTQACVYDSITTGTNSNFEITPTNTFGTKVAYKSGGRTGAAFTARQGTQQTALTTTTATLLLTDSNNDSYILNPASPYTLNQIVRHVQANKQPNQEVVRLRNSSANAITLATGTGWGAIRSVGADTTLDQNQVAVLYGDGTGNWDARIVT